ncbi:MAG: Lrp/AsnC family transcriptional regulator, partial [Candidatus Bipolaricaulota bacterium]
ASLSKIAEELDISPTTVSNRLQKLREDGIIDKFSLKLNLPALGFGLTAVIKIKAKGTNIRQVVEELQDYPHLTHIYEITGDFDILVIGKFKSREEMNEEIKRLLRNSKIEETNTSVVLSTVKEYENSELI